MPTSVGYTSALRVTYQCKNTTHSTRSTNSSGLRAPYKCQNSILLITTDITRNTTMSGFRVTYQ